jgi:hypothetical protein
MTEQELWTYFEDLRKEPGYPGICDRLPKEKVIQMGKLMLSQMSSPNTKDVIMMTLAHQQRSKEALRYLKAYNHMQNDSLMKIYTQFAVEECEWWNE